MNETLEYIIKKFDLDVYKRMPIEIKEAVREPMAETLKELGFQVGVEVGVAKGDHAELLCEANPNLKLYCVDIWEEYSGYTEFIGLIDQYYEEAQDRLSKYNCELIKDFSMNAVTRFEDNSLDFVYIDAAHDFKNVAMDVCDWSRKVRVGGIVFGHDFLRNPNKNQVIQVKDVVQAYMYSHRIKPWFTLGNRRHSWMFVRQDTDLMRI